MKIAISGPQCTGKTTLLEQISKDDTFKDFKIIKEVVRTIKKRWEKKGEIFEFNRSGDKKSQIAILEEHHRNTLNLKNPHYITDRCSWDAFTYATYNYISGHFSFEEWVSFKEVFIETISSYDLIIYLPTGLIPMKDDSIRDIDVSFQEEIGKLFMEIAKEYKIKFILFDSLENRVEYLKSLL